MRLYLFSSILGCPDALEDMRKDFSISPLAMQYVSTQRQAPWVKDLEPQANLGRIKEILKITEWSVSAVSADGLKDGLFDSGILNVYLGGGDPAVYIDCLRLGATNGAGRSYFDHLQKLRCSSDSVVAGVSAGAMIWGGSVEGWGWVRRETHLTREMPLMSSLLGLGVLRPQIIPHVGSKRLGMAKIEKAIAAYRKTPNPERLDRSFILLNDTAAFFVDTECRSVRVYGTPEYVSSNNERVPLDDSLLLGLVNSDIPLEL